MRISAANFTGQALGRVDGSIDIEGVDGSTVEVHAERIVRAVTDDLAREVLPRVAITEEVQPGRVAIQTEGLSGITIGTTVRGELPRQGAEKRGRARPVVERRDTAAGISGRLVATDEKRHRAGARDARRRRSTDHQRHASRLS